MEKSISEKLKEVMGRMSKFKESYERYKDSGVEWIGEIPEHWGVIKLKYVTKLAYGDSLPTENREEEEK